MYLAPQIRTSLWPSRCRDVLTVDLFDVCLEVDRYRPLLDVLREKHAIELRRGLPAGDGVVLAVLRQEPLMRVTSFPSFQCGPRYLRPPCATARCLANFLQLFLSEPSKTESEKGHGRARVAGDV
jgi:hypothetical protein